MINPDVLSSAIILPGLIDPDFVEPFQQLEHGCRLHREDMK